MLVASNALTRTPVVARPTLVGVIDTTLAAAGVKLSPCAVAELAVLPLVIVTATVASVT